MTNYVCLIQNNFVTEIIVADFDWVLENLEGTWVNLFGNADFVGIGYSYNSATNTFNPPPNNNVEPANEP